MVLRAVCNGKFQHEGDTRRCPLFILNLVINNFVKNTKEHIKIPKATGFKGRNNFLGKNCFCITFNLSILQFISLKLFNDHAHKFCLKYRLNQSEGVTINLFAQIGLFKVKLNR